MKKIFIAAGLFAGVFTAKAQTSCGIHADGIMSNFKATEDGVAINGKSRFSWKAGVVFGVPLTEHVSCMPQLNVLSKGGKIDQSSSESGVSYTLKGSEKLTYLELPINIVYNVGSAEEGGFFIGAGPVLSYGIGGKFDGTSTYTVFGTTQTEPYKGDVKFDGKKDASDDNQHLKAFEFGINAIAGYRLSNGFFVNAHYNLGLSNISPEDNSKFKNSYLGIGIGMFLTK
jgi:hypothetical protein